MHKASGDWIICLDCDEYFDDNLIPLINYIEVINSENHIEGILFKFTNIDKNKYVILTVKNKKILISG